MNRDEARKLLDHLSIVEYFANGGMLAFHSTDYRGQPTPTVLTDKLLISCLEHYDIPKPCCPCTQCPIAKPPKDLKRKGRRP